MLPSRYQAIWNQLKLNQDKPVKVASLATAHSRLKKAIIKRKDIDVAFKYHMQDTKKVAKLEFKVTPNMLIVTLHIKSSPLDL